MTVGCTIVQWKNCQHLISSWISGLAVVPVMPIYSAWLPQTPICGFASIKATWRAKRCGNAMSSPSIRAIYSPVHNERPSFNVLISPMFTAWEITFIRLSWIPLILPKVPSTDPSSIISSSKSGYDCWRILWIDLQYKEMSCIQATKPIFSPLLAPPQLYLILYRLWGHALSRYK